LYCKKQKGLFKEKSNYHIVDFTSQSDLRCQNISMKMLSLVNKDQLEIIGIEIEGTTIVQNNPNNVIFPQSYPGLGESLINMLGTSSLTNEILSSLQSQIENLSHPEPLPKTTSEPLRTLPDTIPVTRSEVNEMIQTAVQDLEKRIDIKLQQTQKSIESYIQDLITNTNKQPN